MVLQGDNCGYMGENGTAFLQQNWVLGLTPVSAGGRQSWWAGVITCLLGEGEALAPAALELPGSGLSSSLTSSFWGQLQAWAWHHLPMSPGLPWEQSLLCWFSASAWAGTSSSRNDNGMAPLTLTQPGLPAPALACSFSTLPLPSTWLQ